MAIALLNWTDGVCWVDGRYDESRELSIKLRNFNQESAFYAFTVAMEIFGESDFSFNKIIFINVFFFFRNSEGIQLWNERCSQM